MDLAAGRISGALNKKAGPGGGPAFAKSRMSYGVFTR
jgi:hypothetical protein